MALDREVESIKTSLKLSIATGTADDALEQRIAALPSNRRSEVEAVRKALQRQRVIDEAVRLRREEIEAGKANPQAEEQRQSDPELKQAVDQWETAYRQEQARKKVEEAQRKIAEIERAKAEEERRRRAEELARQQKEETARREATLRRFNVRASVFGDELHSNPFRFEGHAVILTGVMFKRMIERGVGIFSTIQGNEVLVSRLPADLFSYPGQMRNMIVRIRGTTSGTNLLGAIIQIPHAEYLALSP